MDRFYWAVFENYPDESGDAKRLVWKFDNEEACEDLVDMIEKNECGATCLTIERIKTS